MNLKNLLNYRYFPKLMAQINTVQYIWKKCYYDKLVIDTNWNSASPTTMDFHLKLLYSLSLPYIYIYDTYLLPIQSTP